MAVVDGIPNLVWLTTDAGSSIPRLRLDVYESAYERRQVEVVRQSINLNLPNNTTVTSSEMLVSDMSTAGAPESFNFRITIPNISKTIWNTAGTLTASLQALDSTNGTWVTVISQSTTGSPAQPSGGFQILHENDNDNYGRFRLQITTTGGSISMVDIVAFIDGIYAGNQRRRVENLVASQTTNHISTLSSNFNTLITQVIIGDPLFYIADNTVQPTNDSSGQAQGFDSKPMRLFRFNGTWNIDRVSAERGEGRSAEVLMSLTKEGAWNDE